MIPHNPNPSPDPIGLQQRPAQVNPGPAMEMVPGPEGDEQGWGQKAFSRAGAVTIVLGILEHL